MPLACSAALASIELFETQNYKMEKIQKIEAITRREMEGFTDPRIKEVRMMGGCVCAEVYDPAVLKGYQNMCTNVRVQPSVLKLSVRDGSVYYQGRRAGAGASVHEGLVCAGIGNEET